MALVWDWAVLPGALAGVLALALAVIVFAARPQRAQNRLLALVVLLEGVMVGFGTFAMYITTDAPSVYANQSLVMYAGLALPWVYLMFLGTLDTPLSRPFASRRARWVLGGVALVAPLAMWAWPAPFLPGVTPSARFPWDSVAGPGFGAVALLNGLAALFGLVVAISAYRRAPVGTVARRRARAYVIAFGWRDVAHALLFITFAAGLQFLGELHGITWAATASFVYLILLSYGILKTQLFDIDVRIKLALRKSTVAAIFIATFFVVSELGVAFFEDRTESQILGILTTGLLVFAMAPLQRVAERFSNTAMPGVRTDEAYLDARKLEVYQAALEEAIEEDGTVTQTQTDYLSRLRARLGISERDHALLLQALANLRRGPGGTTGHDHGETVLGRYRIEHALRAGAHGTTYLAHDEQLDRNIVLKALPAHGEDPDKVLAEARTTCQLNHPNIVTVHDVERVGDEVYIVMEHVDGGSLADRLDRGPLDGASLMRVADDLLAALEHVHARDGIHREVKPANVLLTSKDRAKLADYGIASLPGHERTVDLAGPEHAIGTVRYMSPEQAKGRLVDHRSDLYSAAVTLYEACTGTPYVEPRKGESAIETQMRVARAGRPPDAAMAALPEALRPWFARALDPDIDRRFRSATQMRSDLPRPVAGATE